MQTPASPAPTLPLHLTTKEAANYLRLSVRTIQQYCRDKKNGPKHSRFGSAIRIPRDSFLEWASQNQVPAFKKGKRKFR